MNTKSMHEAIPAAKAVGTDERIVGMVEGSADEIDRLRTALEQAERENEKLQHDIHQYVQIASDLVAERDEARGLLWKAYGRFRVEDEEDTLLLDKINAHLRDTGE